MTALAFPAQQWLAACGCLTDGQERRRATIEVRHLSANRAIMSSGGAAKTARHRSLPAGAFAF